MKKHADFEAAGEEEASPNDTEFEGSDEGDSTGSEANLNLAKFGLSYQINLVLPKTDDIAVFNAIFKSLKEHLLKD